MIKAEARKLLLMRRGEVADRERKDIEIYRRLSDIIEKTKPQSIFCYVSMGSEVNTKQFIKTNFGKLDIYVPYTQGKSMTPRMLKDISDLSTDKLGNIDEKYLGDSVDACAISVIPMVGFNTNKRRLGYGGGYYDKYLSSHTTFSVGVAYEEQLLDNLPVEKYDARLNMIITQENYYL